MHVINHFFIVPTSLYFQLDVFHSEDTPVFPGRRVDWLIGSKIFGKLAASSGFLDHVDACIPMCTASYIRRLSFHQHWCNNFISCTFSILFVFLFVLPVRNMYSLTVVSTTSSPPVSLNVRPSARGP